MSSQGSTPPLAALTTIFTPCSEPQFLTTSKIPSQYPPFYTGDSECDPPRWDSNIRGQGFQYYSPAICPSGFFVGPDCEVVDDRIPEEEFPAVTSGETAVYCVPIGYRCTSDRTDFRGGVWGFTVSGQTTGRNVACTVAPAMQIRWRAEDLASLETDPLALAGSTYETDPSNSPITSAEGSSITKPTPEATATPTTATEGDFTSAIISSPGSMPTSEIISATTTGMLTMPAPTTGTTGDVSSNEPASPTLQSGSPPSSAGRSPMALATIILACLLTAIILAALAYVVRRRRGRKRSNQAERINPSGRAGTWSENEHIIIAPRNASELHWEGTGLILELGTEGPTPELGAGDPVGTRGNPAELDGRELRMAHRHQRWSWLSHVSTKLSIRSLKSVRTSASRRRPLPSGGSTASTSEKTSA